MIALSQVVLLHARWRTLSIEFAFNHFNPIDKPMVTKGIVRSLKIVSNYHWACGFSKTSPSIKRKRSTRATTSLLASRFSTCGKKEREILAHSCPRLQITHHPPQTRTHTISSNDDARAHERARALAGSFYCPCPHMPPSSPTRPLPPP